MQFERALIVIQNPSELNGLSIQNALSLSSTVTNKISIIGRGDQASKIRSLLNRVRVAIDTEINISLESFENNFNFLDNFNSNESILFVVIGDLADLYAHIASTSNRLKTGNRWHVISSDFARYQLLNDGDSLSSSLPFDTLMWIRNLEKKYSEKTILDFLTELAKLRVAVVGETIIDEYIEVDALGKTSKDPLLAFHKNKTTEYVGGVLAVGRHFGSLGSSATILSAHNINEDKLVRDNTINNMSIHSIIFPDIVTIRKTRYIDVATRSKVFETYDMSTRDIAPEYLRHLSAKASHLEESDLLLILDYGHYLTNDDVVSELRNYSDKASVNTQSNAGNRGMNSISRYKGFPRMFMNGSEVTVELRRRSIDIPTLLSDLISRLETKEIFVTNGSGGLIYRNFKGEVLVSPAFSPRIIDRTGAGDALMTMVSAMLAVGAPIDISCFFGNIAGAFVLGGLGNQHPLDLEGIQRETELAIFRSKG